MSKISFIKSDDRRYNIERCLSLIKSEIMAGLKDAKNVVVKPSCLTEDDRLSSTNALAIDAVLELIKPYTKGQIVLAEGVEKGDTITAFKNFGYLSLQEKYDLAIIDLNKDEAESIPIADGRGKIWRAKVPKTLLNSDYLISVSPPKTDNKVLYSGAIKNISVGLPKKPEPSFSDSLKKLAKIFSTTSSLPKEWTIFNDNLRKVYDRIPLRLAVLDAFEAMQGDGPINGEMVAAHWAVASSDPIAADFLACQLMGINVDNVPYLSALEELSQDKGDYFVIGDDWKKNIIKFKLHSNFIK